MKKLALAALPLLLAACSRDIQNSDAVRQGVLDYLHASQAQTGLNIDAMQLDVTSVSFEKDQARATIHFRPKAGGDGGMEMGYVLERKGNKWAVKGRAEGSGEGHGAQSPVPDLPSLPATHPPLDQPSGAPSGQLPPGHPAVGSPQ